MGKLVIRTTNGELYHHGIRGQKWGVRRFQNADGSLTAKGQKRMKAREEEVNRLKGYSDYALKNKNYNDKSASNIDKALKSNNKKLIDEEFKKHFGPDSIKEINEYLGTEYKSKKDALKDRSDDFKSDSAENKRQMEHYKKSIERIQNTPINKLSSVEKETIKKGANRAAFVLNTAGAIALGTFIKKNNKNNDLTNKDIVKSMIALDLLFTAGAAATNSMIVDASEKRAEKKRNS